MPTNFPVLALWPIPVTLDLVPETKLQEDLALICRLADMDVGSVEYLIPRGE